METLLCFVGDCSSNIYAKTGQGRLSSKFGETTKYFGFIFHVYFSLTRRFHPNRLRNRIEALCLFLSHFPGALERWKVILSGGDDGFHKAFKVGHAQHKAGAD